MTENQICPLCNQPMLDPAKAIVLMFPYQDDMWGGHTVHEICLEPFPKDDLGAKQLIDLLGCHKLTAYKFFGPEQLADIIHALTADKEKPQ